MTSCLQNGQADTATFFDSDDLMFYITGIEFQVNHKILTEYFGVGQKSPPPPVIFWKLNSYGQQGKDSFICLLAFWKKWDSQGKDWNR